LRIARAAWSQFHQHFAGFWHESFALSNFVRFILGLCFFGAKAALKMLVKLAPEVNPLTHIVFS
jgi:hypothetical protein